MSVFVGARAAHGQVPVHTLGVGRFGVLGEVDAGGLVLGADPEAHQPIDYFGEHERDRERVERDDDDRERLLTQLMRPPP